MARGPLLPSPFILLRPFHVGYRAAGHVGEREPRVAPAPWGPTQPAAPTSPLPGPRAPTSSWAPAPAASAFSGPRGQARAGRRGHLRSPNPDPGDRAGEAATAVGAQGRGPLCCKLQQCCALKEAKHSYTFKKKEKKRKKRFPLAACISPGHLRSPVLGRSPGPRGGRRAAAWGPAARGPGLARRPGAHAVLTSRGWSLHTEPGEPGPATARGPTSTWAKFPACDPRRPSAVSGRELVAAECGVFSLCPRAPQTLFSLP